MKPVKMRPTIKIRAVISPLFSGWWKRPDIARRADVMFGDTCIAKSDTQLLRNLVSTLIRNEKPIIYESAEFIKIFRKQFSYEPLFNQLPRSLHTHTHTHSPTYAIITFLLKSNFVQVGIEYAYRQPSTQKASWNPNSITLAMCSAIAWPPRRMCYRPTLFFLYFRLVALSYTAWKNSASVKNVIVSIWCTF
jgi:hypothetical protein